MAYKSVSVHNAYQSMKEANLPKDIRSDILLKSAIIILFKLQCHGLKNTDTAIKIAERKICCVVLYCVVLVL